MREVYIISGTLGVGKTTCTSILLDRLNPASLIRIDDVIIKYEKSNLDWHELLALVWSDILSNIDEPSKFKSSPFIVDCVVDDGEEKYLSELSKNNTVYYFQLIADEKTLKSRIESRGDDHMISRQLEVLSLIKNNPIKLTHSLNTTNMSPEEVASYIVENKNSFIFKPEVL